MSQIKAFFTHPASILLSLNNHGLLRFVPDETQIRWMYYASLGKHLNLNNPKTFNEKLQWLKLFDRNPLYSTLVDKYAVKEYVKERIGTQYVIPSYGVWNSYDEIDFDILPDQFVLKTTHDGGGNGVIVCQDKKHFDIKKSKFILEKSLKRNVYKDLREWPYKNVRPRILAEALLTNDGKPLKDYKIHNFNGISRFILVCQDRYEESGLTEDFFTTNWERIPVRRPKHPNSNCPELPPEELPLLLELSKTLSEGIPFVRSDFYIANHQVYFGELTFFPTSGYTAFVPDEYDGIFGNWLSLPSRS